MSVSQMIMETKAGPFIKRRVTTDALMLDVLYAVLPLLGFGTWLFGLSALALTATTVAACVLAEQVICMIWGRPTTLRDYHAVVTGVLLALTLPPGLPLYMAALGGVIAIAIGKMLFGGLGRYLFSPVLVGRIFLQAVFPAAMATYVPPAVPGRFTNLIPSTLAVPFQAVPSVVSYANTVSADGWAGATPLNLAHWGQPLPGLWQLLVGAVPGNMGETPGLLILICGAFLAARGYMKWRISAAVILSALVAAVAFAYAEPGQHPAPLFTLFAGGLMLGAVFIATDPVVSPTTRAGMWVYGILIGVVTVALRYKTPLLEGVFYAILLGNLATPLIDRLTGPRPLGGTRYPKKKTL